MARALLTAMVLASLAAGCDGGAKHAALPAGVVSERRTGPRELDLTVRSAALGRTAQVRLLTPAGWSPSAKRTWPVLYLLHGCCDTFRSWTRSTDVARLPQLRGVLVVMPEGGDVGFYSNWLDGPRWEDFHVRELPRILAPFGAGTRRAVAGLSMGGLGALDYATHQPRAFVAAASFSGVLHPLRAPRLWLGLFAQYVSDADSVWGDPHTNRDVWRAHDPTELAPKLAGVPIFVSAGDGRPGPFEHGNGKRDATEAEVGAETHDFVRRAKAAGVAVHADLYGAGVHDWPYWQRELHRALPLLLAALRA